MTTINDLMAVGSDALQYLKFMTLGSEKILYLSCIYTRPMSDPIVVRDSSSWIARKIDGRTYVWAHYCSWRGATSEEEMFVEMAAFPEEW